MELKLTLKQKRFSDEYIASGNATEAAIRAGYSVKTARFIAQENLTKPNVKAHIEERLKAIDDAKIADVKELREILSRVARGEEEEEVILSTADGMAKAKKKVGARERLKAVELLGRTMSMFTDRLDINTTAQVVIIDDVAGK